MWTNGACRRQCQCIDVASGSISDIFKTRAAHAVPGCSHTVQRFRLIGPDQVHLWTAGTRADTDISAFDTSVGGHHQCGGIGWVRTVDRTSRCGRGGDARVATG